MSEITGKIVQENEQIPYKYGFYLGRNGNFSDYADEEVYASLLDGHYILKHRFFQLSEFGVARTAEEADRRLYASILEAASRLTARGYEFELIDETHYAKERLVEMH